LRNIIIMTLLLITLTLLTGKANAIDYINITSDLQIENITENITIINSTIPKLYLQNVTSNITLINTTITNISIVNSTITLMSNNSSATTVNMTNSYIKLQIQPNNIYAKNSTIHITLPDISLTKLIVHKSNINAQILYSQTINATLSNITTNDLRLSEGYNNNTKLYSDSITSDNIIVENSYISVSYIQNSNNITIKNSTVAINNLNSQIVIIENSSGNIQKISASEVLILNSSIFTSEIRGDTININRTKLDNLSIYPTTTISIENSEVTDVSITSSYLSSITIYNTTISGSINIPTVSSFTFNKNIGNIEISISGSYTIDTFSGKLVLKLGNPTIRSLNGNITSYVPISLYDSNISDFTIISVIGDITLSNSNISQLHIQTGSNIHIYASNIDVNSMKIYDSSVTLSGIVTFSAELTSSTINIENDIISSSIYGSSSIINMQRSGNSILNGDLNVTFTELSKSNVNVTYINGNIVSKSSIKTNVGIISTVSNSNITCNIKCQIQTVDNSNITGQTLESTTIINSIINISNITTNIIDLSNITSNTLFIISKVNNSHINTEQINGDNITIDSSNIKVYNTANINGTIINSNISVLGTEFYGNIDATSTSLIIKSTSNIVNINGGNVYIENSIIGNISNSNVDINGNGNITLLNVTGSVTFNGELIVESSKLMSLHTSNSNIKIYNSDVNSLNVYSSTILLNNTQVNTGTIYSSNSQIIDSHINVDSIKFGDTNILMSTVNVSSMYSTKLLLNESELNVDIITLTPINAYNSNISSTSINSLTINMEGSKIYSNEINTVTFQKFTTSEINSNSVVKASFPNITSSKIYVTLLNSSEILGNIENSILSVGTLLYSKIDSSYVYNSILSFGLIADSEINVKNSYSQIPLRNMIYSNITFEDPKVNNYFENISSSTIISSNLIQRLLSLLTIDNATIILSNSENLNNETTSYIVKYVQNSNISIVNNSNMKIIIGKFYNINITAENLNNVIIELENGTNTIFNVSNSKDVTIYYYNVTYKTFNIDSTNQNVKTVFIPMPTPKLYKIQFDTFIKTSNDTSYMKHLFDNGIASAYVTSDEYMNLYGILNENISGITKSIVFIIPYNVTYGVNKIATYGFDEYSSSQFVILKSNEMIITGYSKNGFLLSTLTYGYGEIEPYITATLIRIINEVRYDNFFVPIYIDNKKVISYNLIYDLLAGRVKNYYHTNYGIIVPLTHYMIKVFSQNTMTHGGNDYRVRIYSLNDKLLYDLYYGETIDENISKTQFVPYNDSIVLIDIPDTEKDRFILRISKVNANNGTVDWFRKFLITTPLNNITIYPQRAVVFGNIMDYQLIITNFTKSQYIHIYINLDNNGIESITTFYTLLNDNIVISYADVTGEIVKIIGIDSDGYFVVIGAKDLLPNVGMYYTTLSYTELT